MDIGGYMSTVFVLALIAITVSVCTFIVAIALGVALWKVYQELDNLESEHDVTRNLVMNELGDVMCGCDYD